MFFQQYALYFSLVVQFSRIIVSPLSRGDLVIIPLSFPLVNTFLKSFFTFFKVFSSLPFLDSSAESLVILSPFPLFVKRFLEFFLILSAMLFECQKAAPVFVHFDDMRAIVLLITRIIRLVCPPKRGKA